jgi:ribosomal protein S18 acetylase RimI-like enzyme
MYLKGFPTEPLREVGNLKIIPARASFKHVRALAEESARDWNTSNLADAKLLHLDDPHTDALVALRDGVAAAYLAVMSVGEIGAIQDLYVSSPFRRQGIGRTMMSRALEIAARSLFKHVFVSVGPENEAAIGLYHRGGFAKIGEAILYRAPE